MRFLILIPLVIASALEYFSQGHFGLAMVSGLYVFLTIQAEHAAKQFARYGLVYPDSSRRGSLPPKPSGWDSSNLDEMLKVNPLGEKKSKPESNYQRPASHYQSAESPKAKPTAKIIVKAEVPKPKPAAPKIAEAPRFHGKPHEVLVVQENAATQTIVRAFRHWVKKYHPDHAHSPAETQSANEHTRMLTDAKEKLLYRRKQMRKPSSA